MSRKKTVITVVIAVCSILVSLFFMIKSINETADEIPDNLIYKERAKDIVRAILGVNKDVYAAYIWKQILVPGDTVSIWGDILQDGDSAEGEQPSTRQIERFNWFAWVDKDPGNIFFAHETQFIYIDARTGEYMLEDHDFWPVINNESFEGDVGSLVNIDIYEGKGLSAGGILNSQKFKNFFIAEANARETGKHIHIYEPESEYEHQNFALIVAGFGKNDWVFLEGAHEMYRALNEIGYDDEQIVFLAPVKGELNPAWDRGAEYSFDKNREMSLKKIPKFIPSSSVDGYTSPMNFRLALEGIQKKMSEKDSLFVFMLSHGKKNKMFALGEPVSKRENMGETDDINGRSAGLTSKRFAEVLVGRGKACEVMILIDSCYAGAHEASLKNYYENNKDNIKRIQVAYSAKDTISYGADYRKPVDPKRTVKASMDEEAKDTPIRDLNAEDQGGEFSSGFIENIGSGIFSSIYDAGVALDAASLNKKTTPYTWMAGSRDPCVVVEEPSRIPDDQAIPEPESKKIEKISVIPYGNSHISSDQLERFGAAECDCCDEEHWHATGATARTIDGQIVSDPYSGCGLGKTSEAPIMEIELK